MRLNSAYSGLFAIKDSDRPKMWLWPIRGWLAKARLSPKMDLNAEESSTNEPHEQTIVFIGTSFSCRARGSNPGPLEIVIMQ